MPHALISRAISDLYSRIEGATGGGIPRWVSVIAVAMSVYHLVIAYLGQPVTYFHLPVHLMFAFLVIFWCYPVTTQSGWTAIGFVLNLILSGLAIAACGYLFLNVEYLQTRLTTITPLTPTEFLLGISLIVLILEAVRRTIGWVLVVIVALFLAYAAFGSVLPYPFWHRGYTTERIVELLYFTTDGIWGSPLEVTAAYVFLFILFGALLIHSGGGEFFTRLARAVTGRTVGGPAKVAVIASTFMGMISGSSPANVVTTGSFTIPAMKKRGYTAEFAGGVEAAASANGQVTPPIMGAAAFLMMEFLGISYVDVMGYAAIPALLCFLAVYIMVHLEARRLDLADDPTDSVVKITQVIRDQGYLLLSVVVLMAFLIRGYTPGRACFWSIVALVALLVIFDGEKRRWMLSIVLAAMATAPRMIGSVSAACAAAGIIVGITILTGLGLKVSTLVLFIAGGNLILTLVFTMIVAVILSMGMPTSGAYIILAVLLAPAMIELGVLPIAAHMFILYCASKSAITPPVAIASYAAAAVAGSDPWQTSWAAFRIAITVFIIPYMFVFGPAILGIGPVETVVWVFVTASIGLWFLGGACIGWMYRPLLLIERLIFFAAAVALIKPGWLTDSIGLSVGGAMLAYSYWSARR
jgi:TRAP transporter 4TM/12TM fusion protein